MRFQSEPFPLIGRAVVGAMAAVWVGACVPDTGPSGPAVGSLNVITFTSGSDPDPDGYGVSVDGAPGQPIGTNSSLTLARLTPGDHTVQLGEVASNCTVSEGG